MYMYVDSCTNFLIFSLNDRQLVIIFTTQRGPLNNKKTLGVSACLALNNPTKTSAEEIGVFSISHLSYHSILVSMRRVAIRTKIQVHLRVSRMNVFRLHSSQLLKILWTPGYLHFEIKIHINMSELKAWTSIPADSQNTTVIKCSICFSKHIFIELNE